MVKKLIKLDLSFGNPPPNHPYIRPSKFNPCKFPWNIKSETVEEAFSGFLMNRIPAADRGKFMDELWRVLIPGGKATIVVPYWTSMKSVLDAATQWPPFNEMSFYPYNKQFRESQGLNGCMCDFDVTFGYALEDETRNRSTDMHQFWVKHYVNSVNDLHANLVKKQQQTKGKQ